MIFEGKVFDVKDYMPDHPGGPEYISKHLGTNIEDPFEEAEHTKKAKKILLKLPVVGVINAKKGSDENSNGSAETEPSTSLETLDGKNFKDDLEFDYDKPLYAQFVEQNMSFDQYMAFLHYPKVLVNPVRSVVLFENPILEFLTKSPWWHVLIVYSLDTLRFAYSLDWENKTNWFFIVAGVLAWTFLEYAIHQYMLHPEHFWLKHVDKSPHRFKIFALHLAMHGMHHAFPTDPLRMLEPAFISSIISHTIIYPLLYRPLLGEYADAAALGTGLAYMCYDLFHFFLHKGAFTNESLKGYRSWHMQHHYNEGKFQYGVTTHFWDNVIGTGRDKNCREQGPDYDKKLAAKKDD